MGLWDNQNDELWDKDLPPDLVAAIKPLRKSFDRSHFAMGWSTRHLCYAQLHNELGSGSEDQEHVETFQKLKLHLPQEAIESFRVLIQQNTLPSIFKAYFDFYIDGMANQARLIFGHFLDVGLANEHRLPAKGVQWAEAQAQHLIRSHRHNVQLWIIDVCDKNYFQSRIGAPRTENDNRWYSWQAPSFLVMKPSKYATYDPGRLWERQDAEASAAWLEAFADDYVLRLEMKIEDLAGAALLKRAKSYKPGNTSGPPTQPTSGAFQSANTRPPVSNSVQLPSILGVGREADDAPWQHLASEFAKLAGEEKLANVLPLGAMVSSTLTCSSDLPDWAVHNGCSENFRARFELLASQAGMALGPMPVGESPFSHWLHRLYQNLRENRSSLSRFFIGSDMEAPLIDSMCEASSTFCLRLQKRVLERDQQKHVSAKPFQDWIESNSVSVSIPGQISERSRVSLVAESASTPIPIEFLSSKLYRMGPPHASTVFGSPRDFFNQVAEAHGLLWAITPRGLWMAQQPPSSGEYTDANGCHYRAVNRDPADVLAPRLSARPEATTEQGDSSAFSVSADFRSVIYRGHQHSLTRNQAVMLKILVERHRASHPVVDKDTLLTAVESETSTVRDFWKGSPLWRTLIISKKKGTYQLDIPKIQPGQNED